MTVASNRHQSATRSSYSRLARTKSSPPMPALSITAETRMPKTLSPKIFVVIAMAQATAGPLSR